MSNNMLLRRVTLSFSYITVIFSVTSGEQASRSGWPKCDYPAKKVFISGGSSVTLMSPNFPASYDYSTKCGWSIRPVTANVVLTVNCDTFQLQDVNEAGKCPDYLEVKDTRYCGSIGPQNITATNLKIFKVMFKSNTLKNYGGFRCTVKASNHNTDGCSCGARGTPTSPRSSHTPTKYEFPWMAALVMTGASQPFCGASIIYENFFLTSGSCIQRIKHNKYNYEVLVGAQNLSLVGKMEVRHDIKKVFLHDKYKSGVAHSDYNIGLVQVKTPVDFSQKEVRPVCLPRDSYLEDEEQVALLTGWGTKAGSPDVLKKVETTILDRNACEDLYNNTGVSLKASWLCATQVNNATSICDDDTGGPLVTRREDGRYEQVGVAIFGEGCNSNQTTYPPTVYSNVSRFMEWIKRTVDMANTCS
ncbi:hypothetical protein SK128_021285 [Halocaridina rubra]|uniref:Uncharacterized protein n=1 Tax=Halocaridina rubra TaxID=373956 RepID=A0AAN8ZT99_HALRR